MMVSKVAVIALVAILAVPILMGYGLNLSEETVTDYKQSGDSVNLTELLQTGTAYTPAKADVYTLNTNFNIQPVYENLVSTSTTKQLNQYSVTINNGGYYYIPFDHILTDFFVYIGNGLSMQLTDLDGGTQTVRSTAYNVVYAQYYKDLNLVMYRTNDSSGNFTVYNTQDWLVLNNYSGTAVTVYFTGNITTQASDTYVDFAAGYHFTNLGYNSEQNALIRMPDKSQSILMTLDLDSITDTNYSFNCNFGFYALYLAFVKTTSDGVVSWQAIHHAENDLSDPYETIDLNYDPNGSNTYQVFVKFGDVSSEVIDGYTHYYSRFHIEFRYIGAWPTLIGAANYYNIYEYDFDYEYTAAPNLNTIWIGSVLNGNYVSRTPIIRVDTAEFRAFAYNVISDRAFAPHHFKSNPTTTIEATKAGRAIVFAGNTYDVDKNGDITLGTHKVSVGRIVFESVPVVGGQYANKINDNIIAYSNLPSTITFLGDWSATVNVVSNEQTTYNHTEWTPGEFAWDGLDQNFLMIGLLAALGAFIALGIAYRQVKSAIFALFVVCGGAMLLFITML